MRRPRSRPNSLAAPCPLDHVNRQFHAPAPNRLWLSDFTHVATWTGFVYVALVIDAYARRIVGWRVSRTAHAGFVLDALEQACTSGARSIAAASSTTQTAGPRADSSGRRNRVFVGGGEALVKRLGGRLPAQGFAGSGVQGGGHRGDLLGAMCAQVRAFKKVLPQQAVGVLVRAALPGTAWSQR